MDGILGSSMKFFLSLMKNILPSMTKGVLVSLGLTAVFSAAYVGIYKKNIRVWDNNIN